MRWIFINCILLATTAHVLSGHRSRRDLSYIKNLIASKLFGTETIFIQLPEIPKNETHRLFKIKGYNDFIIKVYQKPEKKKEKVHAVKEIERDPAIVSPEMAIIGNYLGTTTQGETLLAIEFVKNLLKSGILSGERDKLIQEVVPKKPSKKYFIQEPLKPVKVFTEKQDTIYAFPPISEAERIKVVNHNPISLLPSEYPPLFVASEIKYKPVQTKYSYEQKGQNADMKFESYSNQDVIVTRTDKEPQLPEYIKLRFAEAALIGANPYFIRYHQPVAVIPEEHLVQPINIIPNSYGFLNPSETAQQNMLPAPVPSYVMSRFQMEEKPVPGFSVAEDPGYVVSNNINRNPFLIDRNPEIFSEPLPFDIRDSLTEAEIGKMNQIINENLHHSKNNIQIDVDHLNIPSFNPKLSEDETLTNKNEATKIVGHKSDVISENSNIDDVIVKQYLYKQMNRHSRDNNTVVKVEDPLTKINVNKSSDELPDDFIYMPPEHVVIPPPNVIPRMNDYNQNNQKNSSESENKPSNVLNKEAANENTGSLKTNNQLSLTKDPIVVLEDKDQKIYSVKDSERGKTSFRPYTGGPVF